MKLSMLMNMKKANTIWHFRIYQQINSMPSSVKHENNFYISAKVFLEQIPSLFKTYIIKCVSLLNQVYKIRFSLSTNHNDKEV